MEPKQNVIEIGPDGIKKSLNKVLRGWAKQYAEAEKKGPLKSNPYTQLRAAGHLTADFILEDVRTKVESVAGIKSANVNLVFEPAWDQSMMSEEARVELGFD